MSQLNNHFLDGKEITSEGLNNLLVLAETFKQEREMVFYVMI